MVSYIFTFWCLSLIILPTENGNSLKKNTKLFLAIDLRSKRLQKIQPLLFVLVMGKKKIKMLNDCKITCTVPNSPRANKCSATTIVFLTDHASSSVCHILFVISGIVYVLSLFYMNLC